MVKPIVLPITYKSDPKGLRKAEAQLKGFASGVSRAVGGAVAAVAGIGAVSVKAFADFDGALNKSLAIMGDVSESMRKDMSDAAREVAKQTTFSAEQAAESYFFLASAGLNAEQSISALPEVAKFAQAGMFDMATATDLLTDAQSALGLTSDDTAENLANMTNLSDVLVKANTLANASVSQFSEALTNKAAASMRSLNIATEEGVAVLAVFADQGIKGSEAGTRFNATIRGLTNGVQRNAEDFARLGIEVFNAEGEMNNMADIVADLEGAIGGMSVEQQRAELTALGFTEETLAGTLALLGNSEAIREYEAELRNAAGTTDDVANNQMNTLSAQFGLLKSEMEDVGIMVGQALEPAMIGLIEQLKPVITNVGGQLIPAFKNLAPVLGQLIAALPGLVNAFLPLIPAMVQITIAVMQLAIDLLPVFLTVIQGLLPVLEGFTAFLVENSEILPTLVISVGGLVAALKGFNAVVRAGQLIMLVFNAVLAMNPITLIVLAVAALTAALIYFFTQTEVGQEIWAAFTEFVINAATAIGDWFMYVFGEWFPGLWQGMVDFFTGAWDTFKEYFFGALEGIGDFFKSIINGWIGLFEGFINFIIGGVNKLINALNTISVDVPATAFNDAFTFGVNIPNVPEVALPRLADGGIVSARPGGIIANIGEGRYDEAVIPLRPGMGLGNTYNVTVNAGMGTNGTRVGEEVVRAIKQYERTSGPVFARA